MGCCSHCSFVEYLFYLEKKVKIIKKLFLYIVLVFVNSNVVFADFDKSRVKKKYKIDNKILVVSNNHFLDEIWMCSSSLKDCKLLSKVFSFVALAKECEAIKEKNIYFAQTKDYYFMGGWNEVSPLKIFDLKSNLLGTSPDIEYAKNFCKFKVPSH